MKLALKYAVPVVLLLMVLEFSPILHPSASAQVPQPHTRWQYASLLTSARLCKWTAPDDQKIEEGEQGYAHLYTDLGGTKPPDKISLVDLMNLIGNQGWELSAVDGGEGPHQYLFKRPMMP
jgi:hypothetical protein